MTCIVVCLLNGKTYADYCAQIASSMLPSALSADNSTSISTVNGGDEFEDAQEGNSNSSDEENENVINGEDVEPLSNK